MSAFERAFALLIGHEGGYVNNPADPGGETKYGISKRVYPGEDIRAMTLERARAIYKRDYWDRVCGDLLPAPLALLVFDAAVNCGASRAAKWLQQAAGVKVDGLVGPKTVAAAQTKSGAELCAEFMALRTQFMAGLPTWGTFGKGWSRRLCALPFQAMQMGVG